MVSRFLRLLITFVLVSTRHPTTDPHDLHHCHNGSSLPTCCHYFFVCLVFDYTFDMIGSSGRRSFYEVRRKLSVDTTVWRITYLPRQACVKHT